MTSIFQVISLSEATTIKRKDGTEAIKQTIVLRELGSKYADTYLASYIAAYPIHYTKGKLVVAALSFQVRDTYQDIYVQDISLISTMADSPAPMGAAPVGAAPMGASASAAAAPIGAVPVGASASASAAAAPSGASATGAIPPLPTIPGLPGSINPHQAPF